MMNKWKTCTSSTTSKIHLGSQGGGCRGRTSRDCTTGRGRRGVINIGMEEKEPKSKSQCDNNKDTSVECHHRQHKEVSNGNRKCEHGGVKDANEQRSDIRWGRTCLCHASQPILQVLV